MTAQIGDTYFYENKPYSIIAMSDDIGFDPVKYGLKPLSACSGCWRGFCLDYIIEDKKLFLKNVYVIDSDTGYPSINGVQATELENLGIFHYAYTDVSMLMNYTGKIIIGNRFLWEYYVHMGFQEAWAYETVLGLVFENGALLNVIDYSKKVKKIRKELREKSNVGKKEHDIVAVFKNIDKSFSVSLEDKAWWID